MILRIVAVLALSAGALHAQDLPYSDTPTLSCLQDAETYTARLACAGASAQACIDTPEGGSTVGTGGCLDRERLFWDALLNEYYQAALSQAVAYDKDLDALDSATPRQAVALRAMQRSWIVFRDAACAYEASRWGGGTGAGPAAIGCAMQQTARQALSLQDWSR
ncbi:lysozyme inhibitor LprI family protein [Sulfitobacter sp. HNIBRBA3233]|uniref:lysozyme inhibitor LprI family protein n=1 Tax=Sulfitobacter marinivivus TaxID=3158558 RepID=UPI0032DF6994